MSYNITRLKVRSLSLIFPLAFDFQAWLRTQPDAPGKQWCIQEESHITLDMAAQQWKLNLSGQTLAGTIKDDKLHTKEVDCYSDGSGHIYRDILLPLFQSLQGNLNALVVWEGGESVVDLSIVDGAIEEEEIA